jgi:6-phosphogluconolactonase (cycloisomerase 2 family)
VDVQPSQGATPFGFDFDNRGRLFVSEAFGGAPLGSATSSYELGGAGAIAISPSVPTTQTAACWLDVSPDGKWAYVGNAGSGTVSTYRISHDGSIVLAANSSLGMGARALDVVTSPNGRFVHVINSALGSIVTFRAMNDGSLLKIDEDVLAPGIVGIATR